jgi:hypothetical protein
MKIDNFNLQSISELGAFHFTYVGNAVGGGEWWGIYLGERCIFHIRAASQLEVEDIFTRQKNYPYYCPTEKDHFFFFEDQLYHVTPSMVDPLAEMIILYFSRMTKKLKPAIKNIQREFGESLVKFDKILKQKVEKAARPSTSKAVSIGASSFAAKEAQPLPPTVSEPTAKEPTVTAAASSIRPSFTSTKPPTAEPSFTKPPASAEPSFTKPPASAEPSFTKPPASAEPSFNRPIDSRQPPQKEPEMPSFTTPITGYGAAAAPAPSPEEPAGDRNKELQRERMRERRRRLGLPDDVPT